MRPSLIVDFFRCVLFLSLLYALERFLLTFNFFINFYNLLTGTQKNEKYDFKMLEITNRPYIY